MTKVTLENCNEIIAEFMELKLEIVLENGHGKFRKFGLSQWKTMRLYTESLDSLKAVWEKLGVYEQHYYSGGVNGNRFSLCYGNDKLTPTGATYKNDMVKAAALATAKAIMEISNGS